MRSTIHNMTRFDLITVEETNCRGRCIVILKCQGSVSGDHCDRKDSCYCDMLGDGCQVLNGGRRLC